MSDDALIEISRLQREGFKRSEQRHADQQKGEAFEEEKSRD